MKTWWFIFLVLYSLIFQVRGQNNYLSLDVGYGHHSLKDQLINYYIYSGGSFHTFHLGGQVAFDNGQLQAEGYFAAARLEAQTTNELLYAYNYSDVLIYGLQVNYLRNLWQPGSRFSLGLGPGFQAGQLQQEQHYFNVLYDYAKGYRRSYVFSPASLSLQMKSTYQFSDRQALQLEAGYSVFGIMRRPSDNYVKQNGASGDPLWTIYSIHNFSAYSMSLEYDYSINKSISVSVRNEFAYQHLKGDSPYAVKSNFLLVGIKKTFR